MIWDSLNTHAKYAETVYSWIRSGSKSLRHYHHTAYSISHLLVYASIFLFRFQDRVMTLSTLIKLFGIFHGIAKKGYYVAWYHSCCKFDGKFLILFCLELHFLFHSKYFCSVLLERVSLIFVSFFLLVFNVFFKVTGSPLLFNFLVYTLFYALLLYTFFFIRN